MAGSELTLIPCKISSVSNRNDYCPTLAEGESKEDIIQRLQTYSARFGVVIEEDGRVMIPEAEENTISEETESASESN